MLYAVEERDAFEDLEHMQRESWRAGGLELSLDRIKKDALEDCMDSLKRLLEYINVVDLSKSVLTSFYLTLLLVVEIKRKLLRMPNPVILQTVLVPIVPSNAISFFLF